MKKIIVLFFVIISLILITGCNNTEHESVLVTEITGVFKTTVIPLPENYGVLTPSSYCDGIFITDLFILMTLGNHIIMILIEKHLLSPKMVPLHPFLMPNLQIITLHAGYSVMFNLL